METAGEGRARWMVVSARLMSESRCWSLPRSMGLEMFVRDAAEEVDAAAATGVEVDVEAEVEGGGRGLEKSAVDGGQSPADERLEMRVAATWPAMVAAAGAEVKGSSRR
jgi:hypothetical protein